MKLYLTAAGIYAGTQAEAKANGKGWTPEEVPTDKYGLIDYLNALKFSPRPTTEQGLSMVEVLQDDETVQDYTDAIAATPNFVPADQPAREAPSPGQQSIDIDETFDRLPLAHQLHLAAKAMENARDKL